VPHSAVIHRDTVNDEAPGVHCGLCEAPAAMCRELDCCVQVAAHQPRLCICSFYQPQLNAAHLPAAEMMSQAGPVTPLWGYLLPSILSTACLAMTVAFAPCIALQQLLGSCLCLQACACLRSGSVPLLCRFCTDNSGTYWIIFQPSHSVLCCKCWSCFDFFL
jgi:hypothetical protein